MNDDLKALSKAMIRIKPIIEEGLTIEETASISGVSTSSIDKALLLVRKNASLLPKIDESINPEEFLENLSNTLKGNTIKGLKNKELVARKPNWDSSEALRIANLFLANGFTLREAEKFFGYPKSTIHEILNSEEIQQIPELYYDVQRMLQLNLALRVSNETKIESELMASKTSGISKSEKAQVQKFFLMQKYEVIVQEKGYTSVKAN